MKKTMICPHCGEEVEMETRAPLGAGTQRGKKLRQLSPNHVAILQILAGGPMTVRKVQQILFARGIERVSKTGAKFNYHTVQADLSILLGVGLLRMIKKGDELFDTDTSSFIVSPAPQYYIPDEEVSRAKEMMFDAAIGQRPFAGT